MTTENVILKIIIDREESNLRNILYHLQNVTSQKPIKFVVDKDWLYDKIVDVTIEDSRIYFLTNNGHKLRSFQIEFLDN